MQTNEFGRNDVGEQILANEVVWNLTAFVVSYEKDLRLPEGAQATGCGAILTFVSVGCTRYEFGIKRFIWDALTLHRIFAF